MVWIPMVVWHKLISKMISKKIILLNIFLFSILNVVSQELIQNGDFELTTRETNYFLFGVFKYWHNPTLASTDYQSKSHHWSFSVLYPHSGENYMGIVAGTGYNYSEYGTNKLLKELKKDSLYCLTMYVYLSPESTISTYGIEALFTKKRIKVFTFKSLREKYKPDIIVGNSYIKNKSKWMKISGIYKAKGGEKYVTIGNFSKSDSIVFPGLLRESKIIECYLLIDDVSLMPIHDSSVCDCNIKRMSIESVKNDSITKETQDRVIFREGTILSLKNLQFDTDSYEIKPRSYDELDKLYSLLKDNHRIKITVNGYTDNVGSEKRNIYLSKMRAKAVMEYLVKKGIEPERISYKGYGEDNPIMSNETKEGRATNRRVEIEFIKQ